MKYIRLEARIFAVAFMIALASAPAEAKDKWINLTTKNFNIVSNADEDATRKLALKLEQFQSVFSTLLNLRAASFAPITVIVFKSDDSFKPFKPLYNGKPTNVAGYFQPARDENLIALNINANEARPMAVIFHEYTHLLTSVTPRDWPLWLKEGLAEVYSSFEVKDKEVTLGWPITNHVLLLREKKFIPLETLFSVGHDSPEYNERNKQSIFYAESWALSHLLMYGNKGARRAQLREFVTLIDAGVSVTQAFSQAFKADYATIEKELRQYIGNDSYPGVIYKLESTEGDKEISSRPVADAEAQSYLGNLLMRTNRLDEAEAYFKQAIQIDANLARPYEGLGFIAMQRNKYDEAMEHFKQATGRDSKNFLAHYYYGETLQRIAAGRTDPEVNRKIIEELKESIKLNPRFANSYSLLAFAYLVSGENLKEAVETVKTAMKLAPQDKHIALTLAQIQVRMQDYEGAKKTLEPLLAEDVEPNLKMSANSIKSLIEQALRYAAQNNAAREAAEKNPEPESTSRPAETESAPRKEIPVVGRPSLKIEGARVLRVVLVSVECARGKWTLVAQTSEKMLRFTVSDKNKLEFYSQVGDDGIAVECGPVGKVAFIYFKPVTGQPNIDGDAVAVEFTR